MGEELVKYEIKETEDIVFRIKGEKPRFIDGKEFVKVYRWIGDKNPSYILKDSLKLSYK